jgi:hypothetical protein
VLAVNLSCRQLLSFVPGSSLRWVLWHSIWIPSPWISLAQSDRRGVGAGRLR